MVTLNELWDLLNGTTMEGRYPIGWTFRRELLDALAAQQDKAAPRPFRSSLLFRDANPPTLFGLPVQINENADFFLETDSKPRRFVPCVFRRSDEAFGWDVFDTHTGERIGLLEVPTKEKAEEIAFNMS